MRVVKLSKEVDEFVFFCDENDKEIIFSLVGEVLMLFFLFYDFFFKCLGIVLDVWNWFESFCLYLKNCIVFFLLNM